VPALSYDNADASVSVGEESMAYAACSDEAAVVVAVVNPIFGDPARGCNATDSYR